MKNKYTESLIKKSHIYAKRWNSANYKGIYLPHLYEGNKKLSWWDDMFFKLGSQIIAVWWIHPRMAYQDMANEKAFELADEWIKEQEYQVTDIFDDCIPQYKKLGKNKKRKKIVSYQISNSNNKEYYDKIRKFEEQTLIDNDFLITPRINVKQYNWCRGVDICIPEEIFSEEDGYNVCNIVKKLLKGETTLEQLYPNYQYTKEHWIKENKQ